jgi:hypothetical protein
MLLFFVPGYLQAAARRTEQRDGLELTRQVWMSFTSALILIGIVVLFIAAVPAGSPTPWAGLLAVATVALLGAVTWALAKPLTCDGLAGLAASYRTRFFLALASRRRSRWLSFASGMGPPVRQGDGTTSRVSASAA